MVPLRDRSFGYVRIMPDARACEETLRTVAEFQEAGTTAAKVDVTMSRYTYEASMISAF